MIELPAFRVTQGQAANYTFTWTGKDLTGHTGTATITSSPQGEMVATAICTLDATGGVSFTFSAAKTAAFPAMAKVGYFVTGVFQVKITGATNNETFQGSLSVAGSIVSLSEESSGAVDDVPVDSIQTGETPEQFGAVGNGIADDTAAIIAWLEYGGNLYANGRYLIAATGPDSGGAYARILSNINVTCGANCEFIAGTNLDNDIVRLTAQWSEYNAGNLYSVRWRGGRFDQSQQRNSTIVPNSANYPPANPGTSQTCDGLYILGWVLNSGTGDYFAGLKIADVQLVETYAGDHWETAGGDSGIFVSGAKTMTASNNDCTGNRDLGIYISMLPSGKIPGASVYMQNNVFRACCWGGAVKRAPSGVFITNNKGQNTPQVITVSGLVEVAEADEGYGGVVSGNIGENAHVVCRIDDVNRIDVSNNHSHLHGCTLADGSLPPAVFRTSNSVVRVQGGAGHNIHDNALHSATAAVTAVGFVSSAWVTTGDYVLSCVLLNEGPETPATPAPATRLANNNRVYANYAKVGAYAAKENTGADDNRYWSNGLSQLSAPVGLDGAASIDLDAPIAFDIGTTTVTGVTTTQTLKTATVKAAYLDRSGAEIDIDASGAFSGAGTKTISIVIGGTTVTFTASSAALAGDWILRGRAKATPGSIRYSVTLQTPDGGQIKTGAASPPAIDGFAVSVRVVNSDVAGSSNCNGFSITRVSAVYC